MSYGEALRLTGLLMRDPSSQVAAAQQGWDAPRTSEWWLLADLYDLTHASLAKAPKPYPRPVRPQGSRLGRTRMNRTHVLAILNAHGHDFQEA